MSKSARSCTAFTLIELLVTIAIIAVLAALLFPAIQGAMARANMSADTNRLRQIGGAMAQYVGENNLMPNGVTPISGTESTPGAGDRKSFIESIDRYFPKDSRFTPTSIYNFQRRPVWFSPSAKAYAGFVKPTGVGTIPQPLAFGYNPNVDNGNWAGNLTSMPSRSRFVIMADANDPQGYRLTPESAPQTKNDVKTGYRTSHPGGQGLYLFCDFHVEALTGDRGYSANPDPQTSIWKWW